MLTETENKIIDDILEWLNRKGLTSHQSQNPLERLGRIIEMGHQMAKGATHEQGGCYGIKREYSHAPILTGGPVMKGRLVFVLLPLLFLGSPVYAQSPCSECLTAAEKALKKCLDNAISADDKVSCEESRQAGMKACVKGDCTIERDERATRDTRTEHETPNRPGLTPYSPTKIEWLALDVRSQLQQDAGTDSPFFLTVIPVDHETLLISVRYLPTVNREMMSSAIDSARKVIMTTAKSYGWDDWVKIREQVELSQSKK